jgi:hypothetical protein
MEMTPACALGFIAMDTIIIQDGRAERSSSWGTIVTAQTCEHAYSRLHAGLAGGSSAAARRNQQARSRRGRKCAAPTCLFGLIKNSPLIKTYVGDFESIQTYACMLYTILT